MPTAIDSGKSFLALVLAKLPESLRADAEKALTAPEATDALTLLGDGVLARSDYSKSMDAIRDKEVQIQTDYDKLNTWYADNQARLDGTTALEAEIARLKGEKPTVPDPTKPSVTTGLVRKDLDDILSERDQAFTRVLSLSTQLTTRHLRDFNEVLDMNELVDLANRHKYSLTDAYQAKFGEQLKAKADLAEKTRIDKLVEDRLADERKKHQDHPFPLRNQSPSVLDILETKTDSPANHTLDTALAEYDRLQAARG